MDVIAAGLNIYLSKSANLFSSSSSSSESSLKWVISFPNGWKILFVFYISNWLWSTFKLAFN